jgi:hypothetical protein
LVTSNPAACAAGQFKVQERDTALPGVAVSVQLNVPLCATAPRVQLDMIAPLIGDVGVPLRLMGPLSVKPTDAEQLLTVTMPVPDPPLELTLIVLFAGPAPPDGKLMVLPAMGV